MTAEIAEPFGSSLRAAPREPDFVELMQARAKGGSGASAAWLRWGRRLLLPVAILVIWQLGSSAALISPHKLAPPAVVVEAAIDLLESGDLQAALVVSLGRALTGLAWGVSIGLMLGVVSGLSRLGDEVFDSSLQMIRTIPFIALIPLW
jgi:sulfonate transport system permease protein